MADQQSQIDELTAQVTKVFTELKHNPSEYTCITVYGGVSIEE